MKHIDILRCIIQIILISLEFKLKFSCPCRVFVFLALSVALIASFFPDVEMLIRYLNLSSSKFNINTIKR